MVETQPKISFIVPLFNTGEGLALLFSTFRELKLSVKWEVIFVDDGSVDQTPIKALSLLNQLSDATLIELARNYGEHAAIMEGLRHAHGEFIVTLDDDLQNPLHEAIRLLEYLEITHADIVYGRYISKKHSWFRNLGSAAINACASMLLDKPYRIYLSSFRAMRRDLVLRIISYHGPYPHLDGLILSATNRLEQMNVQHTAREYGSSGYTLRKLIRLAMSLCFNFSIMPLRAASALGIMLCCLGIILLGDVLFEYCTVRRVQPGWLSLMGSIAIFSGAQLLMLGIIGEYMGRTYLSVSGKPQSHLRTAHVHRSK